MNSTNPDTGLTFDQEERLHLLAEECSEVIQICMKILRHGYESSNPLVENSLTNRQLLEKELGQTQLAYMIMRVNDDFDEDSISEFYKEKLQTINQWLHFNQVQAID